MATKKKTTRRSAANFATLDDFLEGEGKREEFEAVAIKELAARMKTSRSQVGRLARSERR
jgi:hypothetical protein